MDRRGHFWERISEGRQIDKLGSHSTADARASYGFYMKESDAEELQGHHGVRRWVRIAKTLFWSMLMKMTPARRGFFVFLVVVVRVFRGKFAFWEKFSVFVKF